MSYELYVDNYILVFYIKDILKEASDEDLNLINNICQEKIRAYEKTGFNSNLYKVNETNYSPLKINQSIYLLINLYIKEYPEYYEALNRLNILMRKKIINEKKEKLAR